MMATDSYHGPYLLKVNSETASVTGFSRGGSWCDGAARLGAEPSHTGKCLSWSGDHESEHGDRYDARGLGTGDFVAKKSQHVTSLLHRRTCCSNSNIGRGDVGRILCSVEFRDR
jgi:hypothetical protein